MARTSCIDVSSWHNADKAQALGRGHIVRPTQLNSTHLNCVGRCGHSSDQWPVELNRVRQCDHAL